jgi:acyl carrier protein
MKSLRISRDPLPSQLKHLVADLFRPDLVEPDTIVDHESLMTGSVGLDSLDVIELVMCVEETFGVAIRGVEESQSALASIASLAGFIRARAAHGHPIPLGATRLQILPSARNDNAKPLALALAPG